MANTRCCPAEIHERIRRDPAAWSALPCIGHMETEGDDGKPMLLELRNHSCPGGGVATLSIEVR